MVFERTGGIAGVHQRIVVDPTGRWTYVEGDRTEHGRLPPERAGELRRLAGRVESGDAPGKGAGEPVCPDAFHYSFTTDHAKVTWSDCGGQPSGALRRAVRLLRTQTPM